jgi:Tfp pilus assembly protein PilZ
VNADERRQYTRFPSVLRCWLQSRHRKVYARLRDISRGGVGLRAPSTFASGEIAEVVLENPRSGRVLRIRAVIVWSHPDGNNPDHAGMGVKFDVPVEDADFTPDEH